MQMPNITTTLKQNTLFKELAGIVEKKPMVFLYVSLGYLVIAALLKWKIYLPIGSLLYLAGGVIGVYFLDIAEDFFKLSPSPFRTVLFQGLLAVATIFVVTSSGSMLASGLVLTLSLTLILWQVGQWRLSHDLGSWYRIIAKPVAVKTQQWILGVFVFLFFVETWMFIR